MGSRYPAYRERYEAYKASGWESWGSGARRPDLFGLPKGTSSCSSDAWRVPGLAKTTLCSFDQDGYCRRGEACTFAHGKDELRDVPPHFRYTRPLHNERPPWER